MIPLGDDNPTRRPPFVTVTIIGACIVAHAWQSVVALAGGAALSRTCGFIPYEFLTGIDLTPPACVVPVHATILTSMFLHGGLVHLGGNMLYLWIFGNNVEDVLGSGRFLAFYVGCGIAAAIGQAMVTLVAAPEEIGIPMVGASGAIAGVLGAYLVRFPGTRVRTLLTIGVFWTTVRLPAFFVLGAWFVLQFFQGVLALGIDLASNVATWAHVFGFVAGLALVGLITPRRAPFAR